MRCMQCVCRGRERRERDRENRGVGGRGGPVEHLESFFLDFFFVDEKLQPVCFFAGFSYLRFGIIVLRADNLKKKKRITLGNQKRLLVTSSGQRLSQ